MNNSAQRVIPKEKFALVQSELRLHDQVFETKPITYFQDALIRFRKNKASVVAAFIIVFLIIFALLTPYVSTFKVSDCDGVYSRTRPKLDLFERSGFWDGAQSMMLNDKYLIYTNAIGMGACDLDGKTPVTWAEGLASPYGAIVKCSDEVIRDQKRYYEAAIDSYYKVGFRYVTMTKSQFERIREWEAETGTQVIYPMIDTNNTKYCATNNKADANYWYRHAANGTPLDLKGKRMQLEDVQERGLTPNYLKDKKTGEIAFFHQKDKNMRDVRVLYYNYFIYKNGYTPSHPCGGDGQGYDIMIRMAHGVRLSLLLSLFVSLLNFTFGSLYGAVEGYYGGWVDLIGERISDVLSGIPFIVGASLFQLHLVQTGKVSTFVGLLLAFCLTGWIGTAYRVRTQFYRFKKEEYILAARTLGAGDFRLMFKHIYPNAIGTIITSSILSIPGTILSESVLSYLGIVNFNSRTMTSLGTLLGNAQSYLATDPHILFLPALAISLLMISFNLFGNGLRDAFNPSLRGANE